MANPKQTTLAILIATISDRRLQNGTTPDYLPDVITAQDYYPFGMLQPGRQALVGTSSTYRYGFNGKENDNDAGKGIGGEQDYGMRIYDPRLGRFLSVDPLAKKYPFLTPYAFAENDVISSVDIDGLEKYRVTVRAYIPWDRVVLTPVNAMTILLSDQEFAVHGEARSATFDLTKLGYSEIIPGKEGYRVQYQFDVDLDASSGRELSRPTIKAGTTKVYQRVDKRSLGDVIMGVKPPNWHEIFSTKAAGDDNQLSVNFINNNNGDMVKDFTTKLTINARFPYHDFPFTGFPSIDARFYLNFTKDKTGNASLSGMASIDGFPAYEGFIQRIDIPNGKPMKFLDWKPSAPWKGINLMPILGDRTGLLNTIQLETNKK